LRERGFAVRALCRSDQARKTVVAAGAEPMEGALDLERSLVAAMKGCELVFHAAALTAEWAPRAEFYAVNVEGTERLLAAAKQAGVRRLVHVSTEAVLIDGLPLVKVDETRPIPEKPIGRYSETKAYAERAVRRYNGQDLETVVVRPRFVWGDGDTTIL